MKHKGLIIYKSKYGCTKQYAEWLSAATGLIAKPVNKVKDADIHSAEIVVIGSPIMNFSPLLKKWMEKRKKILLGKQLFMFTTSGAAGSDPNLIKAYKKDFNTDWQLNMQYFPLSGRFIFRELPWLMQILMKQVQKRVKDPQVKKTMLKDKDGMNKKELEPLIQSINSIIHKVHTHESVFIG